MRNYRKISKVAVSEVGESGGLSPETLQLKKRILRNRRRAIGVGVWYILGAIILAVAALIMPIPARNTMGILYVLDMLSQVATAETTEILKLALYLIIVVVTLVNVIRAFKRKNWLMKKTATLEYGFNRNVYAMLDLGHIFSGSLTVFAVNGFLMMLLAEVRLTTNLVFLAFLAVGLVIHFGGGVKGAKASFFDIDNSEVVEEARKVGRFAPFFRNFMQVGCLLAIMWGVLRVNVRLDEVGDFGIVLYAAIPCLIVLMKHAFGIAEYDMEGVEAKGMKVSRIFFLLTTVIFAVVGINAFTAYIDSVTGGEDFFKAFRFMREPNRTALFTFGVSFFMFIFELIMRKRPKLKVVEEEEENAESESEEKSADESEEPVEEKKSKKEKKKEKKLAKKQAKAEKKAAELAGELTLDATLENVDQKSADEETVEENVETVADEVVEESVETVGEIAPMGMPMAAPMTAMAPIAPITNVPFGGAPSAQVNVMAPSQAYPACGYPQIIPIPYPMPMYMPQQPTPPAPPAQPAVPNMPIPQTNMAMSNSSMLPLLAGMSILPVLNGLGNSMNASALARSNSGVLPSQLMQNAVANKKAGKKGAINLPFMDEAEYRKPTKAEKKAWQMIEKAPVVDPIQEEVVSEAEEEFEPREAPVKVDVNCPFCKRKLTVKSTSHYNRCPACNKIFQLRKSN